MDMVITILDYGGEKRVACITLQYPWKCVTAHNDDVMDYIRIYVGRINWEI